ncbi:ligand-binding sensor domain-containing protein [Paraflavitalea speifideaquila]|uniref:ligand-binding sensor domain-containing protein n=1 Tax=Paraflavitalea speifideaquila TaxID=3076558 RepID=UPI0028E6FAFF|nr:two-component regulator propeller domain-containing protein [Paraflavitalea speifideiaquila]
MKLLPILSTIFLAVTSCLFHYGAKGQYKFDNAQYLNKEQGLPDNQVYLIQKGRDGFMWVGTREGLCRFDGQQFKVYRQGNDLRYSLYGNTVNAILSHGSELWVATNQGISVLNTSTGLFRHYQLGEKGKMDTLTRDLIFRCMFYGKMRMVIFG